MRKREAGSLRARSAVHYGARSDNTAFSLFGKNKTSRRSKWLFWCQGEVSCSGPTPSPSSSQWPLLSCSSSYTNPLSPLPPAPPLVKPDLTRIRNFRIPPFPNLLLVISEILVPINLLSTKITTIRLVGTSGGSLTVRMSGWRSGNTKILIYVFHSMLRCPCSEGGLMSLTLSDNSYIAVHL